jgi:hypothetical protein
MSYAHPQLSMRVHRSGSIREDGANWNFHEQDSNNGGSSPMAGNNAENETAGPFVSGIVGPITATPTAGRTAHERRSFVEWGEVAVGTGTLIGKPKLSSEFRRPVEI